MSLTKTLLFEAVAKRRKQQALQRIAKILYKSHDKEFYNAYRTEYLNDKNYISKQFYFAKAKQLRFDLKVRDGTIEDYHEEGQAQAKMFLPLAYYYAIKPADPTDNGTYINWLVSAWFEKIISDTYDTMNSMKINHSIKNVIEEVGFYKTMLEDQNKINSILQKFEKAKELNVVSGDEADINSYDSTTELFRKVQEFEKNPEILKTQREKIQDQTDVIYDDGKWKMIVPRTHKASCVWGSGTNWCTAVDDGDSDTYNAYMEEGDLIILINDDIGRKFQAHYETGANYPDGWFMNEEDDYGIEEFEKLTDDEFTIYIGVITWHSYKNSMSGVKDSHEVGILSEFDVLCNEFNEDGLSKHYLPTDFIDEKSLETLTKDLIKFINTEEDTNYTKKGLQIIEIIKEYKDKGIRKLWDEIMSDFETYIINDVLYQFAKSSFKESSKAIKSYFESLTK